MAKIKYYFDTVTCKYERVRVKKSDVFVNFLGFIVITLILAIGIVSVFTRYFETPAQASLRKENEELLFYYKLLEKESKETQQMLTSLEERDNNIYRVIFEANPLPESIREGGIGGTNRYKSLFEKGLEKEDLIVSSFEKLAKLRRKMYIQTLSYDSIIKLAKSKSKMLASIPAIQPIENKELKKLASGFGWRIHPIYKVKKMHTGADFSAPRGTPIYATGDGVVIKVISSIGGYGKEVEIDHGFGYITKYAHMENFKVKRGQKVKRGECIGEVGNTGISTGPHLHYEIIHNGTKINPVHFFFNDLNAEEYEKILELASIENQSLS
ncbi:MAG TPA: M23 family metallopeptidase [Cytophagales bacterium]|nr:M23 family metallopeptidase [Cytophagales bacterium]